MKSHFPKFSRALPLVLAIAAWMAAPGSARAGIDFHIELGWRSSHASGYNAAVVFYEYDDYRGRELVLYPGESLHDFSDYDWGFRVRSVRVLGPVHVTLFDQSGLWGHEVTIHGDIPDLSLLRMRISAYSVMNWGMRARSAYVSYNGDDRVRVSVDWYHAVLPRVYCASPVHPRYAPPPPRFRPVLPRPQPTYQPPRHPGYRPPPRGNPPPRHARPASPPPAARSGPPSAPPPQAVPPRGAPPRVAPPPRSGSSRPVGPPQVSPPTRRGAPPSPPPARSSPGSRPPSGPPPPRPGR